VSSPLPDNVPEVGSIKISVGLSESGVGTGFALDGISPTEAIGHLEVLREVLKQREAMGFLLSGDDEDDDDGDERFVKAFHVECPDCGSDLTYSPEELMAGAEYSEEADDEDDVE
jgi:hypothetical protein